MLIGRMLGWMIYDLLETRHFLCAFLIGHYLSLANVESHHHVDHMMFVCLSGCNNNALLDTQTYLIYKMQGEVCYGHTNEHGGRNKQGIFDAPN